MKKITIFLIILLVNCHINAQKQYGKITYEIANIDFVDKGTNADVTAMLLTAKKQKYQLFFNKEQTSFELQEFMSNEIVNEFHNNLAKAYVSATAFYFDYRSNNLFEITPDGTVVENKIDSLQWKITSESKMIDQYQCYKATYSFEYVARDGKLKTRIITAWFAPSLPYSYGPKNYHGLPGLILELNENTITFLASKIELTDSPIEINIPSGSRISKEAYNKAILKN